MSEYVLSLSYGKDSLACLGAIEKLGWPLNRIVHAEVWATDTIQADLPPMVEFKSKADEIIKRRWGITVEHICAMQKNGTKQTYEKIFYRVPKRRAGGSFLETSFAGFPYTTGAWCNDRLKTHVLDDISVTTPPRTGSTAFPCGKEIGATSSNVKPYGLPNSVEPILHGRTQTKNSPDLFLQPRPAGGRQKYGGAVHRYCSGRAYSIGPPGRYNKGFSSGRRGLD